MLGTALRINAFDQLITPFTIIHPLSRTGGQIAPYIFTQILSALVPMYKSVDSIGLLYSNFQSPLVFYYNTL